MSRQTAERITISADKMHAELYIAADDQVSAEDIASEIEAAGVCFGLNKEAVNTALTSRDVPVTLATGEQPQPGSEDSLEFHVPEHMLDKDVCLGIREDLQRKSEIPSVEAGQPIVTRIAGTPGTPGTDVLGNTVEPPPIPTLYLRALSGTELSEDANTVVATITGRPRLERDGRMYRLQVQPSYTHPGDVTTSVGHLVFQGDVSVFGNVMEGTSISATGNIEILGSVNGAMLQAGQSIRVTGNVIKSEITSGTERLFWQQVAPLMAQISLQLYELAGVLEQLDERGQLSQLPFAQIASRVISLRFEEYPKTLQALQQAVLPQNKKTPLPSGAEELLPLVQCLNPEHWTNLSDLQTLATRVYQNKISVSDMTEIHADINLSYTLNAKIRSAGSIIVEGQGCIHSLLEAGEEIQVQGKLRGGSVQAPKRIFAREVGSEAGAITTLITGKSGRIDIDNAYENTVFVVGKGTRKVSEQIGRTTASLDQEGLVQLLNRH
ncbi:DUF342 domain-containing protein [Dethiobacter alkaliphilus]|uniref:DUF342 domain-containing protein n=1 Tax=Dethiobacter alkaliphilus TaxID=427926 RepID=UPI002226304D|nr:FapA family protein [Dethiobacter alkaliphilus]MCW3488720.1 FapA family protein [Dethiobacter alkaliphilus]